MRVLNFCVFFGLTKKIALKLGVCLRAGGVFCFFLGLDVPVGCFVVVGVVVPFDFVGVIGDFDGVGFNFDDCGGHFILLLRSRIRIQRLFWLVGGRW